MISRTKHPIGKREVDSVKYTSDCSWLLPFVVSVAHCVQLYVEHNGSCVRTVNLLV